jgi:hypothetical protein
MGTTFGILGMFESIALASFPIIASSIVTSSVNPQKGYSNVAFFFAGIGKQLSIYSEFSASIVVLLGSTLFFLDQKGSVLLDFINPEKPTEEELQALKKHKTLKFHSEEGGED